MCGNTCISKSQEKKSTKEERRNYDKKVSPKQRPKHNIKKSSRLVWQTQGEGLAGWPSPRAFASGSVERATDSLLQCFMKSKDGCEKDIGAKPLKRNKLT